MIIVDASAILELLLRTPLAGKVEDRLFSPGTGLHAPHLLDVEVTQTLRRYNLLGELTDERGQQALDDYLSLSIVRYPHDIFLQRAWDLRNAVTAYDALYLTLAEALSAPLLTCDRHLARSAGHTVRIECLG